LNAYFSIIQNVLLPIVELIKQKALDKSNAFATIKSAQQNYYNLFIVINFEGKVNTLDLEFVLG
jgi:hypothetical protein